MCVARWDGDGQVKDGCDGMNSGGSEGNGIARKRRRAPATTNNDLLGVGLLQLSARGRFATRLHSHFFFLPTTLQEAHDEGGAFGQGQEK